MDSRLAVLTARVKQLQRMSPNSLPAGEVYELLQQMVEARGQVFDIKSYGMKPSSRMIQHLFQIMREEGAQGILPSSS